MAQKVVNIFTNGLLMDLHPLNADMQSLSNALNATLITSNGNELMLQQDMGNGRVETAYLPEGYVPVGTCEFGDIIYIVSYNPLENKSQIGCFPSPERNITSDETTEMEQALTWKDFQEDDGNGNPTGVLKSTTVKKIVYGNKSLNPGDKYIIYEADGESGDGESDGALGANKLKLSDYGNLSHKHDEWPKLLKLRIVSIEDSGKIVDLDASVKWYDNDYYIPFMSEQNGKVDIDSYRSLVSSAYSIFKSKVSGKLAILAELESIESFNCAYEVYVKKENLSNEELSNAGDNAISGTKTIFDIWFYTSWVTSHNDVNPSGYILTESAWANTKTEMVSAGKIEIPYLNEHNEIDFTSSAYDLPVKAYKSSNTIYTYSLIYDLGAYNGSYEDYISNDSFNAKIDDIRDWYHVGDDYKAILRINSQQDLSEIREQLRDVTNITRCVDIYGKPDIVNGEKSYLYNLADYTARYTSLDGSLSVNYLYYTKTKSEGIQSISPVVLTDDVVNNSFGMDIPNELNGSFSVPRRYTFTIDSNELEQDVNITGLVWNYSVAPVMPYGILDHLAVSGQIDFSKIGSGDIELNTWRYYMANNVLTLTWGLDAYPSPGMGISEIVFDFCDNQGKAASYHITGKTTYAGTFTETINLDATLNTSGMDAVDAYGEEYIHAGEEDSDGTVYMLNKTNESGETITDYKPLTYAEKEKALNDDSSLKNSNFTQHINDAGKIYYIAVYLVKITIKYCPKDIMGRYNENITDSYKTFYRWVIPNGIFNEQYYSVKDFDVLQPGFSIDFTGTLSTIKDDKQVYPINTMLTNETQYYNKSEFEWPEDEDMNDHLYQTIGARVYSINQSAAYDDNENFIGNVDDYSGNVFMSISPGISNGFGTFALIIDNFADIPTNVYLGKSLIKKDIEAPSLKYSETQKTTGLEDAVQPIINDSLEMYSNYCWGYDKDGNVVWNTTGNDKDVDRGSKENYFLDFAGYYNFGEGDSNLTISSKLLDLLSSETAMSKNVGDDVDIYDIDRYGASYYPNFKDSFSLNFAYRHYLDDKVEYVGDGSLTYYDTDGNETLSDKYTKYSGSLNDLYIHASESEAGKNDGGLCFTLTGITFSKMYANELKRNNDVRTLRSVIYDDEHAELNGLYFVERWQKEKIGDLYFRHLLSIGRGATNKNNGHKQFCWAGIESENGYFRRYDTEDDLIMSGVNTTGDGKDVNEIDTKASFENMSFQSYLRNYAQGYNIMAFAFSKPQNSINGPIVATKYFKEIRSAFGAEDLGTKNNRYKYLKNADEAVLYDFSTTDGWSLNKKFVPYCFAVADYDNGGNIIPICDFFAGRTRSSSLWYFSQLTSQTTDENGDDIDCSEHQTLANMVGSLYGQLYVVDESEATKVSVLISNYVSLEQYTETWHKDIVIEIMPEGLFNDKEIMDEIAICGARSKDYLNYLATNSMGINSYKDLESIGVNLTNVDFDLNGIKKAVDFSYSIPYDVSDLTYIYETLSETMHHLYPFNMDPNEGFVRVYGDVIENLLYTYDGVENIQQFDGSASLHYINSYKQIMKDDEHYYIIGVYGDEDTDYINRYQFSKLADILSYESNVGVTWHNVDSLYDYTNSYKLTYKYDNGADRSYDDIPGSCIFKEHYPGV